MKKTKKKTVTKRPQKRSAAKTTKKPASAKNGVAQRKAAPVATAPREAVKKKAAVKADGRGKSRRHCSICSSPAHDVRVCPTKRTKGKKIFEKALGAALTKTKAKMFTFRQVVIDDAPYFELVLV